MPPTTQTRRILIKVDTTGDVALRKLADQLGGVNRHTKTLATQFRTLTGVLSGWIGFLGVSQLVQFSDSMQQLNNRIAVLSGSSEEADKIMKDLLRTANETNTSIDSLAEIYARLAGSLSETKITTSSLLDITKVLQNSFRLSGSAIAESTATVIQLSQAFASGQVRGQELRSVLEQNVVVSKLLRKEFGADIYKKAAEGAITAADVLRILFKNMDDINGKAQQLTPTIGQTLIKAFNNLKVSINDLNKDFNISGNFAKGLDLVVQKLGLMAIAIGLLAATQIPALIFSLNRLRLAAVAFSSSNPLLIGLTVISVAIVALNDDIDDLINKFGRMQAVFIDIEVAYKQLEFTLSKGLAKLLPKSFISKGTIEDLALMRDRIMDLKKESFDLKNAGKKGVVFGPSKEEFEAQKERADLLASLANNNVEKQKKLKDVLAELNQEYSRGAITAGEYADKLVSFNLFKLNKEFTEGKINLLQHNEGFSKLKTEELVIGFNEGRISLEGFKYSLEQIKLKELDQDLKTGKLSLMEFRIEMAKISSSFSGTGAIGSGLQQYLNNVGTTTEQVAGLIKDTFTNLEGFFTDFIKNGKANFSDFAKAILDDLTKIIVRSQIVAPLAQGLLSALPSGATPGGTIPQSGPGPFITQAKGGVWDKGIQKFAAGGIVNTPTLFGHSKGTGLMGEAGPEAILPLSRGSSGNLGVEATVTPVTINIINNSSSDVQQQERMGPNGERMIEVLISNKMKDAFNSGAMDKTMQSAYGIKRKGS